MTYIVLNIIKKLQVKTEKYQFSQKLRPKSKKKITWTEKFHRRNLHLSTIFLGKSVFKQKRYFLGRSF